MSPAADIAHVRAFNRFHTRWVGALAEGLHATEHSLTEARVLYELGQAEATPTSALRERLRMDSGHLSRVLAEVERRGLVERRTAEGDGRRRDLVLTRAGRSAWRLLDDLANEDVETLLSPLGATDRARVVEAMGAVRRLLDEPEAPRAVYIREPRAGELGWIVQAHGALYAEEYGWNGEFEALVARVVGDFGVPADKGRARGWIAEVDGVPAGCLLCVPRDESTAQLRLLLVTPLARGLGIGACLVDACVDFARDAGYERLMLWTNDVLVHARPIYERAGFELVSSEPHRSFGHDLVGQDWVLDLRGDR